MLVSDEFIDPTNGDRIYVSFNTDGITVRVRVSQGEQIVDFNISRSNIISLCHMVEMIVLETPLDRVEIQTEEAANG